LLLANQRSQIIWSEDDPSARHVFRQGLAELADAAVAIRRFFRECGSQYCLELRADVWIELT
jgi:hypothetical protein